MVKQTYFNYFVSCGCEKDGEGYAEAGQIWLIPINCELKTSLKKWYNQRSCELEEVNSYIANNVSWEKGGIGFNLTVW